MARSKWKFLRVRKKGNKTTGVVLKNTETKDEIVVLNPHGKYQKAVAELNSGKQYTNDGKVKKDDNGKDLKLTKEQKAYRAGYRSAMIDNAKAYNRKKKRKAGK